MKGAHLPHHRDLAGRADGKGAPRLHRRASRSLLPRRRRQASSGTPSCRPARSSSITSITATPCRRPSPTASSSSPCSAPAYWRRSISTARSSGARNCRTCARGRRRLHQPDPLRGYRHRPRHPEHGPARAGQENRQGEMGAADQAAQHDVDAGPGSHPGQDAADPLRGRHPGARPGQRRPCSGRAGRRSSQSSPVFGGGLLYADRAAAAGRARPSIRPARAMSARPTSNGKPTSRAWPAARRSSSAITSIVGSGRSYIRCWSLADGELVTRNGARASRRAPAPSPPPTAASISPAPARATSSRPTPSLEILAVNDLNDGDPITRPPPSRTAGSTSRASRTCGASAR